VWAASHGTVASRWNEIAKVISTKEIGNTVATGRACKDKYDQLYSAALAQKKSESKRSGSAEEYAEIDQLLLECIEETEQFIATTEKAKADQERRAKTITQRQNEMKEETMLSLGARRNLKRHAEITSNPVLPSSSSPHNNSLSSSSSEGAENKTEHVHVPITKQEKRVRSDTRTLIARSLAQNEHHFERIIDVNERIIDVTRQHIATVKEGMTRSNDLFERLIDRMTERRSN